MAESWQPLYKRKPVLCDTANVNNMTTPIIELADDMQTSKGLWHYIQGDTRASPPITTGAESAQPSPMLCGSA